MHTPERPDREGERSQNSIEQRQRQIVKVQRRNEWQRQHRTKQMRDQERHSGAKNKPGDGADDG